MGAALGMDFEIAIYPRARTRVELTGDIPGHQRLDLVAFARSLLLSVSHYGHPRSMPQLSSSSDNFFLA